MSDEPKSEIPENEDEALALVQRLTAEIARLRDEIDANNARIEELERLADTDPLTPTMNRRAFIRELNRTASFIGRYGGNAWLLFLDLDRMKAINDGYGHAAGDEALKVTADTLLENLRSSDAVGRLGGDEFGVILRQADEETARTKAESLMTGIGGRHIASAGDDIALSVSCGIAQIVPGINIEEILEDADNAMYAVKAGR